MMGTGEVRFSEEDSKKIKGEVAMLRAEGRKITAGREAGRCQVPAAQAA